MEAFFFDELKPYKSPSVTVWAQPSVSCFTYVLAKCLLGGFGALDPVEVGDVKI